MPIEQVPLQGYSALYYHIARYPELGIFRRLAAYWSKKVHDDTGVFLEGLRNVNEELGKIDGCEGKSILDCPLVVMKKKYPEDKFKPLYKAWNEYDVRLVKYGETLCMSEQIMKLPHQHAFHTEFLGRCKPPTMVDIFENGVFVPTGEDADTYQKSPERNDTCAWRGMPQSDFLTMCFMYSSRWIRSRILARRRNRSDDPNADAQMEFRHDRLVSVMDTFSCLLASILLAVSVLVLAPVRPLKFRITIIGVMGTLFALSVKLMCGNLKRGEVFGATAAFYAVAAVFVGSTSNGCVCR